MNSDNSNKTEVTNIINQVVQCNCNKHNPEDFECDCENCLDEQIDRLNEQLVAKAIADTEQRIIKLLESNATGEYKKVMLTPKLILEIKGDQK